MAEKLQEQRYRSKKLKRRGGNSLHYRGEHVRPEVK